MSQVDPQLSAALSAIPQGGKGPHGEHPHVHALRQVPLFAGLSRRHLHHLADIADEREFSAGRTVVQNGSRGDSFYVILDGKAKVTAGYSTRALAKIGPGDFFGELALLDGGPRTASVIAETWLTTIRIGRTDFRAMIRSEPEVALKVMEELARRLREDRSPTQ